MANTDVFLLLNNTTFHSTWVDLELMLPDSGCILPDSGWILPDSGWILPKDYSDD